MMDETIEGFEIYLFYGTKQLDGDGHSNGNLPHIIAVHH